MAQVQQIYARLFTHIDVATSLLLKQDLVDAEPDGRRIQLRIKPPKAPRITLRLTRPKRVARATGGRKRA